MAKQVLIIGAGKEQKRMFELAQRLGLVIIAVDVNPSAACFFMAHHSIVASSRDPGRILAQLAELGLRPDAVTTLGSDVPLTLAGIAKFFGLTGPSMASADLLIDKYRMKEAFRRTGIPTPPQLLLRAADNLNHVHGLPEGRLISKPTVGRGSAGVARADNPDDLEAAVTLSRAASENGDIVIESYVDGPQFSVEGFVLDGKTTLVGISERNYSRNDISYPHVVEDGGTIAENYSTAFFAKAEGLLSDCADALLIRNGPIKGDFVQDTSGDLQVIEIAGRLSGGWLASHQIPAARGVDLVEINLRHALGEQITAKDLRPRVQKATAIRYWFPSAGTLRQITGYENLKNRPDVILTELFVNVGDVLVSPRKHSDRVGCVISVAPSKQEAIERAESAIRSVSFQTTVGE